MKKYIVFAVSFILLFSLFILSAQVLSGMFLTPTYVPDINEAWNASAVLPQQTEIFSSSNPFSLTLLLALLSSTFAYFISQKFPKHVHNNVE